MCVNSESTCGVCGKEKRRFSNGKIAKHCHHCGGRVKAIKPCVECGEAIPPLPGSGRQAARCKRCTQAYYRRGAVWRQKKYHIRKCKTCKSPSGDRPFCSSECERRFGVKTCLVCGAEFAVKSAGVKTKTCSDECAKQSRAITRGSPSRDRTCVGCGAAFRMKNGTRRKGLYCSRECAFKNKREWGVNAQSGKTLRELDKEYTAAEKLKVANALAMGAVAWMQGWKQCMWCYATYWSRGVATTCGQACERQLTIGGTRLCTGCGIDMDRRQGKSRSCARCKAEKLKSTRQRIKARRKMVVKSRCIEMVVGKKVFKADRYHCWICLGVCKRQYSSSDPASPTVDHVVPLAKGGEHSYANCRTAHAICNSLKSDG